MYVIGVSYLQKKDIQILIRAIDDLGNKKYLNGFVVVRLHG